MKVRMMLDEALFGRVSARLAVRPHQGGWRDQGGPIIDAALLVLADGHPRSGDEIWEQARKRGLLLHTQQKDVYIALVGYIERHSGSGRWSAIVQDVDRRFRLNHPIDDWPDALAPLPVRSAVPDLAERRRELEATQRGTDGAAFELAVCHAFAALGFRTTHVGGNGAPDGYIDAPLGLQPLFAPGFVRQHIDDVGWERAHGSAKRVAVVCDILRANAVRIQTAAVAHPADAPRLDENAALLMADAALTALDAHRPCVLADIRAAFRHLTDPLVGEAVFADPSESAIVFRRLPST